MKKSVSWTILLSSIFCSFGFSGCSGGIHTQANDTFFPTERSSLHREELKEAYLQYEMSRNQNTTHLENYEIYNLIDEANSEKYSLDIFQVEISDESSYYVKYKDDIYMISPFPVFVKYSCLNHVAVTDINKDGYLEILTALNAFSPKANYALSFIQIIDTRTGYSIDITDYDNTTYFKENADGVISLYNTDGVFPFTTDVTNGKLDERFYKEANHLLETPKLNDSKYEFSKRSLEASCNLYSVEITIEDHSITFPYLFKSTYTPISFEVNVKMTYLGETFHYVDGDTYLDGATVEFVNENDKITYEPMFGGAAITEFTIVTGDVISRTYQYREDGNQMNKIGVYDMVINYENQPNQLDETIVIKDFLKVSRS